jgi:hypothetical protein
MMFTFKHTILAVAVLALGFVACGDSGNKNTDVPVIGQGGAVGTGGAGAGGNSLRVDAAVVGTGGNVGIDAAIGTGGSVAIDGSSQIVDATGSDTSPIPAACTNTAAGNLAIINAAPAAGVVAVDVPGPIPPKYDPATATCQ